MVYLAPPTTVSVSIVIGTRDRPGDLHGCLSGLVAQQTNRQVEIIVVDNNPSSGETAEVVAMFPGVRLVREERRGVACARNAGILASVGEIIVTVDDDVRVPSDWLEKLVAPFSRSDCWAVTGNVLPLETETAGARLFEAYGGLGRGAEPFEVDREWFKSFRLRAVPTWRLGGTANAAFRRSVFEHPRIGLMNEMLGSGMPAGVGEDTYLFYRVLKAGGSIRYEPSAYVWHRHRPELDGLRRQIYAYSKGHVAYHLITLLWDHDLRAVSRLVAALPVTHLGRLLRRAVRSAERQMLLVTLIEIAGNLAGPWSLWRSYRMAKRQGRDSLRESIPVLLADKG
ncbi:MAG TPA: glycosyltransferase [Pyrinomonadaceae bacterium]|jgi:GT2 family glycosyltransferase